MDAGSLRVFVPSKNRPNTKIVERWKGAGITPLIFVEPQDAEAYAGLPIEVLPKDNQGLVYSRNYILEYARTTGQKWFVMCDDDIENFSEVRNGRAKTGDASIVLKAWELAKKYNLGMTGLAYRQYGWSEKKPVRINTKLPEVCVIMQTERLPHSYRHWLELKEDRDFAMRAIQSKANVAVCSRFCVQVPNIGSNEGGLYEAYQDDARYLEVIKRFVKEWPKYSRIVKRKGRFDLKIEPRKLAKDTQQQTI